MSKAVEDLKHDHEAILSALKILDRIATDIEKESRPEKEDLDAFVGFLKEFADKCHHGKEEGLLFPALARAGIPDKGSPVGVMLSEHVEGRNHIKEMEAAIGKSRYEVFAAAATQYSGLLRAHIQKENDVLFPMAERALDEAQLLRLHESFEEHEEKVVGLGRHEELHEMLKSLKAKYLA